MQKTYLLLEDGEKIEGESFGYNADSCGEVVFTTGMTGYPETLTDPSFAGQIVVFTFPLLGNYGVPRERYIYPHLSENFESEHIWARGVVVSSQLETPSHYQIFQSLSSWLKKNKIPAISHVDTRALTRKIREKGTMRGVITSSASFFWDESSVKKLVSKTSCPEILRYKPKNAKGKKIILIDCGVKHGIIRALLETGYEVLRVPWNTDVDVYLKEADGLVCSNGPGDPKDCPETIEIIRKAIQKDIPFLGICLGHQLGALALGADTYKLPYGHRGLNQPCLDVRTQKAYITSQNHGYAVVRTTLPKDIHEWFINLNDSTNEGFINEKRRYMTTQFHPEGKPGPFDTQWIFNEFLK